MTDESQAQAMAWLAQMMNAKIIVEAGTYNGAATRILADVNPDAMIYTADPYTSPSFTQDNIVFHQGDFLEMLDGIEGEIDLAYIDATPPSEHGTALTYNYRWLCGVAASKRLSPGGLVCWDDTNPAGWREPFVELEHIKEMAQINMTALKGFSIYSEESV
jgi:predicted O-methyltransferase YrrM